MNGYDYGQNNPVMHVDPDGHRIWLAINAGFAAYDGYKAYKKTKSWKKAGIAAGKGALGGALNKGYRAARSYYFKRKAKKQGPFVPTEYWTRNALKMGSPNSRILHHKLKNGVKEKSTVIYDKYGRQKYRVDYNNHGRRDHTKPHLHVVKYSANIHEENLKVVKQDLISIENSGREKP